MENTTIKDEAIDPLQTINEGEAITHPIHKTKLTKTELFKRRINDFLLDHKIVRETGSAIYIAIILFISAFTLAYGYRAFTAPTTYDPTTGTSIERAPALINGGASGISQVILRFIQICGYTGSESTALSILYFLINVPLFFVAFKFVGKKFAILTGLNVGLTSFLINYMPQEWTEIFTIYDDYTARALFSGILTGISSGVAFYAGTSGGGVDIITYAIAEKKSTNVGKYSTIANGMIVITYTFVNAIRIHSLNECTMTLYSLIYFVTSSKVIDLINIKNKKVELQINTELNDLAEMLMRSFPHGCTIVDSIGGYTHKKRKIIYMIVSSSEVKQVVSFVKNLDPNSFVNVNSSNQVYGKFFIKPIK